MVRALQRVEASYRGIVEDHVNRICRYRSDGRLTFVNGAYAAHLGRKRADLIVQSCALAVADLLRPAATYQRAVRLNTSYTKLHSYV
jgi:PAS domain-containing protein